MFRTSLQALPEGPPWGVIGGVIAFAAAMAMGYFFVS
jgi:hypothetical protein